MTKLLITSIGSMVGQNVLDTLDERRDAFWVAGTTSVSAIALNRCDRVYLVPPSESPPSAFAHEFAEVLRREQPDVVLPGRDRDVTVLAEMASADPDLAARLPCGDPGIALMFEDKWLSHIYAQEHGLSFADSAVVSSDGDSADVRRLAERHGFPLIAKPRLGFGSRDVRLILNQRQLAAALGVPGMIFQEYLGDTSVAGRFSADCEAAGVPLFYSLEAPKFSLQTLIRRDGSVGTVFCTVHTMRCGRSVRVEALDDPELQQFGARYAGELAASGWRGSVNLQCQLNAAGQYTGFELNGRMTGASAARYFLGYDELGAIVEDLTGAPAHSRSASARRGPLKFECTRATDPTSCSTLEQHRMWPAAAHIASD